MRHVGNSVLELGCLKNMGGYLDVSIAFALNLNVITHGAICKLLLKNRLIQRRGLRLAVMVSPSPASLSLSPRHSVASLTGNLFWLART